MKDIEGWMGKRNQSWLKARAKEAHSVVEVGVWKGRTTQIFAEHAKGTVYAVDTWSGVPDDPKQHSKLYPDAANAFEEFRANMAPYIQSGRVVPVTTDSLTAARRFAAQGLRFDLVFIDADHRYEAVRDDVAAWSPLVADGGILCGHDFNPKWPGVVWAVSEAFPEAELAGSSIWWVRL